MTKSVDQCLYDLLFSASLDLKFDTYTFNPKQEVNYPFVVIRDVMESDIMTKNSRVGSLTVDIHLYGDGSNRLLISSMMHNLIVKIRDIAGDSNVSFVFLPEKTQKSLIQDTSTERNLWHGLLEVQFKYFIK